MERTIQLTDKFTCNDFYGEMCNMLTFSYCGHEVLQAYKSFIIEGKEVAYDAIDDYGYRHSISKAEFMERYNRYLNS
jgi:hypothetical protein